jgi:hypothetical protein
LIELHGWLLRLYDKEDVLRSEAIFTKGQLSLEEARLFMMEEAAHLRCTWEMRNEIRLIRKDLAELRAIQSGARSA